METAHYGDWVQVHLIVLPAGERAPQVPDDTAHVPFEMWVKGWLQHDATLGDTVEIITVSGRRVSGKLASINPGYSHGYGKFVPELQAIGPMLKHLLQGDGQ